MRFPRSLRFALPRVAGRSACAGDTSSLTSLPLCGFAQTTAASTANVPPPVNVQPLSETKVEVPLSAMAAQTSGAASGAAGSPQDNNQEGAPLLVKVQPLSETKVEIPIAPAAAPASGAPTGAAGTSQAKDQAVAALPPDSHPNGKKERKAEKLYLQGAKLLDQDDCHGAYQAFTAAAALDPANQQYGAAREIARQHLVTQLVQEAVKARLSGHPEVSRQKLEEALVLDPKNPVIAQHVQELANDQKMFVDQDDAESVDAEGPIELTPANVKKSFHLKGTQQEILRQVLSGLPAHACDRTAR